MRPQDLIAGCDRLTLVIKDPLYSCFLLLVDIVLVALSDNLFDSVDHLFLERHQPCLNIIAHVNHAAEFYHFSLRTLHSID